jgi:hypothetical protein
VICNPGISIKWLGYYTTAPLLIDLVAPVAGCRAKGSGAVGDISRLQGEPGEEHTAGGTSFLAGMEPLLSHC